MNTGNESGASVTERERKRERFADNSTSRSNRKRSTILVAGVAAAIVVASAFFLLNSGDSSTSVNRSGSSASAPSTARSGAPSGASAASATVLAPEGEVYRIPTASITSQATFFKATVKDGTVVPFFAVRDASGRVHVALDACQTCARAKKGYTQDGDDMHCRNCGMTFAIAQITDMRDMGGCHPIVLPTTISGDAIVVRAAEVVAGAKWF